MRLALVPPLVLLGVVVLAAAGAMLPRLIGRDTGYVIAAGMLAGAVAIGAAVPALAAGETITFRAPWFPAAGISFVLVLDGLSVLFALIVLGIGALVMAYTARYLSPGKPSGRLYGLLTAFAASMLGLVLSGDAIVLFVFWELTSVTSFFLIGGDGTEGRKPAARALLVTAGGGLALFAGLVLAGVVADTFDLHQMIERSGTITAHPAAPVILVLVLAGAFTKSAQVPFHFWLPGAMVAPTPVSTYLHAATMVKAGIFLLARLTPIFVAMPAWRPAIVLVGLVTAVFGAWVALKQFDLKALLAYSTISTLGFITALVGVGTFHAMVAAATFTIAHALYKATLFMVVGIIDHTAGSRDIRSISGLRKTMPLTAAVTTLALLSMAGLPPLLGFVGKEEAFAVFLDAPGAAYLAPLAAALAVTASMLTFAYGARILEGVFGGRSVGELRPPSTSFLAPAAVPALAGLVLGLSLFVLDPLVGRVARDAFGDSAAVHLTLWHGLTPALALSVVAILGGVILFAGRRQVDRVSQAATLPVAGAGVFDRSHDAVVSLGTRVGRPFVSSSPPRHLVPVLAAAAVAGVAAWMLRGTPLTPPPPAPPEDWVIAVVLGFSAVGVTTIRTRRGAIALMGIAGFLVAIVFATLGAPDLALTQLLVETLTVILMVLVFRRLPNPFPAVRKARRAVAAGVAVAVGLLATLATFALTGHRGPSEVGTYLLAASEAETGGRNVVNTILVDFRALDTLGEVTVLAVAAIGLVVLVSARGHAIDEQSPEVQAGTLIVRATVRALTPATFALAVYLLLRGHNAPGGGFIAALAAGGAIVLQYIAFGRARAEQVPRLRFATMLGAGIVVCAGSGAAAVAVGGTFLQGTLVRAQLPVLGQVKVASSLGFDIGVFLVVVALVVAILRYLGREGG